MNLKPTDMELHWMYLGIRQYLATDDVGRRVTNSMIDALNDEGNITPDERELCMGTIREALFLRNPVKPEALK